MICRWSDDTLDMASVRVKNAARIGEFLGSKMKENAKHVRG